MKSLIITILLLFSITANADQTIEDIEMKSSLDLIDEVLFVDSIEEVENNFYYSLVYEVLGKDALLASLMFSKKEVLDQIKEDKFQFTKESEITGFVFDAAILINYIIIFIIVASVITLVVKMLKFITAGAGTGDFLYGKAIKGPILSVFISMMFFIPMNNIPVISNLYLSLIGVSTNIAGHILSSTNNVNLQTYPEYNLPSPFAKKEVGFELIEFASCVVENGYAEDKAHSVFMPFEKEGNYYKGNIQLNDCHLKLSIEKDSDLINRFSDKEEFKVISNDIEKAQQDAIQSTIKEALNRAFSVSEVINREVTRLYGVYSDSNFNIPVSSVDNLDCTINRTLNTRQEISDYINQQSSCISSDIANKLVFTKQTKPESVFSPDSLLYGRARICSADIDDNLSLESLDECVKRTCSIKSNGEHTGLFECSVSSSVYDQYLKAKEDEKKGFLFAPAVLYNQNVNHTVSKAGRQPYNTLTVDFKAYLNDEKGTYLQNNQYNSASGDFSVQITINQTQPSSASSYVLSAYKEIKEDKEKKISQQGYFKDNAINFGKGGEAGIFGVNKFVTCLDTPYYHDEYISCSSVLSEANEFGNNLFQALQHYYLYSFIDSATMGSGRKTRQANQKILKNFGEQVNVKSGILNVVLFAFSTDYESKNGDVFTGNKTDYDLAMLGITPAIQAIQTSSSLGGIISFFITLTVMITVITVFILEFIAIFYPLGIMINWFIHVVAGFYIIPVWSAFIPALLSEDNESTKQSLVAGFSTIFKTAVFPAIFVIGLMVSWLIVDNISSLISLDFVADVFSTTSTNLVSSILTGILIYFVFLLFLLMVFYLVFSVPENMLNAVGNVFESNLMISDDVDRSSKIDEHTNTAKQTKNIAQNKKFK